MPNISRVHKQDRVQSVRFKSRYWSEEKADKWLTKHGYYNTNMGEKHGEWIAYRQYNPLKSKHYVTQVVSPTIHRILEY